MARELAPAGLRSNPKDLSSNEIHGTAAQPSGINPLATGWTSHYRGDQYDQHGTRPLRGRSAAELR
ncbi:hypothetical protein DBR24_15950 [Pseudomonas sp. HMWF006]|nr:hypothetical protein DBR24_15950 [Pseudomonas sp. HMWF006]PTT74412.1 hypothetical protein DBR26_00590 [Pseudomonas sp. HMWF007]PTT79668.1 hypothetical protein DBR29_30525 [Pseudomonas sp. HMWF005]